MKFYCNEVNLRLISVYCTVSMNEIVVQDEIRKFTAHTIAAWYNRHRSVSNDNNNNNRYFLFTSC